MKETMKGIWDAICKFVLLFFAAICCLGTLGLLLFIIEKGITVRMLGFVFLLALLTVVFFYEIFRTKDPWGIREGLEKLIDRLQKENLEKVEIITELGKIKS